MLKFSYYIDNVKDRAWFESSNIVYGECDESDTQFKTVRIVFKNGSTYQYEDVHVSDWVMFKNAESQGKALNEHFKKEGYKYKRIEDADIKALEDEYAERSGNDILMKRDRESGKLVFLKNNDLKIYSMDCPDENVVSDIKGLVEALNYKVTLID